MRETWQGTAHHDKNTAAQLATLGTAAAAERDARLREQSALAGFITRHRELAARSTTAEQCDQAARVLANLYQSERTRGAAVGHHADELHIRLAGCTAWADDTAAIINAGPQGREHHSPHMDALAEGVNVHAAYGPVPAFINLWQSINGPDSWGANPFVWAISFKRVEAS